MDLIKNAPIVKVVMLKGADGARSNLSELNNDMNYLTREEIETLVTNIIQSGSVGDIDTGFVTKLKEANKNKALSFWVGTQAEYDAITSKTANTFYIITDDTFRTDVTAAIAAVNARIDDLSPVDIETELGALQATTQAIEAEITDLTNAYLYHKDDTITNETITAAGYITGNGEHIHFLIPLSRILPADLYPVFTDSSGLIDNGFYARVYQGGHYLAGGANAWAFMPTVYSTGLPLMTATKTANYLEVTFDTENYGFFNADAINNSWVQNNAPISISLKMNYRISDTDETGIFGG